MAEEESSSTGNVTDTSMAGLLKHIETNVIGDMFDEPDPLEPNDDSVKYETPEGEVESTEEVKEEVKEPAEEPKRDKVQERIDKLTAQKKSAEEELVALKSKVEELSKAPTKEYIPAPTRQDPLADVLSFDELRNREAIAESVRENCLRNPDGYTIADKDGKEVFFDVKDVREALVETDRLLRKDIPNRANWLTANQQSLEITKQDFPWMFDSRTPEYQLAQTMERNFPDIKKIPQYKQFIGYAILGEKTINAEKSKKSTAPKAEGKKLPTPPATSSTTSTKTTPSSKVAPKLTNRSTRADAVSYIMDTVLKNYKE